MQKTSVKKTEIITKKPRKKRTFISSQNVEQTLLGGLEMLRDGRGVFTAANSSDYAACWIRDQLYSTLAYFYTGERQKFSEGIWVVFDILHKYRRKIEYAICHQPTCGNEYIHAKFHPETFNEVTKEWGHHQLDAIGLFLYLVGFAHANEIHVFRNGRDIEIIQILVSYLTSLRYWDSPDNGMWEEELDLHASSVGACIAGLSIIKEEGLAVVPDQLIREGREALYRLLPNESPARDADMAQLSLLFPYNLISHDIADVVLERIKEKLVREKGLNRYWDDNYYRSQNGVSAEWTMGFFWLSIIESDRGNKAEAKRWFQRGLAAVTNDGHLPELYQDGKPNQNTPLAWSHSFAVIAAKKLGR